VQPFDLPGFGSNLRPAILQVTVDAVFPDTLANDVVAAPLHIPDHVGDAVAMLFQELVEPAAAVNQLSAVAAGGAPADTICFNERHRIAAFCQRQGS
jgi:hypothetical protein